MSIEDGKGNEIIRLHTVHAWVFKISLYFLPLAALWLINTVLGHDKSISNLNIRVEYLDRSRGVSQNVNVGERNGIMPASGRTWLTTSEVAEREQKSERTITSYIEQGLISPPPQRNGKAWMIAEDYRILPQASANLGAAPP